MYQRFIEPSEPVEEFDDRNPYLTDSAGHPGSQSRQIAYNDILYLCEKYRPLDSLERYDPSRDLSITGAQIPFL
ncbi:ATP-dependent Clp protease ATP-binding protein subunit ClpB [Apiospora phragmitis]|uniref:ATP-dependent Clp protease ATP-binding protein subunit ClpB n=1 Tax=Apiospora phragmitis TaxID=2905665 RepID=A0ABR1SWV4_9PEZI